MHKTTLVKQNLKSRVHSHGIAYVLNRIHHDVAWHSLQVHDKLKLNAGMEAMDRTKARLHGIH